MTEKRSRPVKKKKRSRRLSKQNRDRLLLVFAVAIVCFLILIGRLIQINVKNGEEYKKTVLTYLGSDSSTLPYKRGEILDRNGTVLASSEKIYSLVLDPYVVNTLSDDETKLNSIKSDIASTIETYFGIDADEVIDILNDQADSRYVVLKKKMTYDEKQPYDEFLLSADTLKESYLSENGSGELTESQAEEITALKSRISYAENGIWFEDSYKRVYPFSALACDVIGFTTNDGAEGMWGLESYYDSLLCGVNGRSYSYLDESMNQQNVTEEARDGSNIVSSIDINIQRITEKYIAQFEEETGAENVGVIVMNPNNGEILSMASAPVFDLNSPRDLSISGAYTKEQLSVMSDQEISDQLNKVWRNFCVNDTFEPGSTVKTMTVAYALDQGIISPSDTFYCDGGETFSDGTYVTCNSVHGTLSLAGTLLHSCNDAMMQIAAKLGVSSFTDLQQLFGFGQLTGIDLPGEADCASLIFTADNMGETELGTSAFGQGYNATMVQVAAAFSSLVNGGYYYQPHVVNKITTAGGSTTTAISKTLMRRTVSEETSQWLLDTMYETVENGTAKAAQVEGYKVGGKTGTAQKHVNGKLDRTKRTVSFIGVAPTDNPQVVIYVVVDEAHADDQGQSSFASKIASNILGEALPYLQIFPEDGATVTPGTETDETSGKTENISESESSTETYAAE